MERLQTIILIPSHGLEDFPTDIDAEQAGELLNAFALSWDPLFFLLTERIPQHNSAEISNEASPDHVYLAPSVSADELPSGWKKRALERDVILLEPTDDRYTWLQKIEETLASRYPEQRAAVDILRKPEVQSLRRDFHALGFCFLMLELLTRKMRSYPEWDRTFIQSQVTTAAKALIAGEHENCQKIIKVCFEIFLEARERFYPVPCYLLDLCMVVPEYADEALSARLDATYPQTLLCQISALNEIATIKPDIVSQIKTRVQNKSLSIAGGDWTESDNTLLPFTTSLWQLDKGGREYKRLLGEEPRLWASRKFNLTSHVPDHLQHTAIRGAVHLAFDDGTFPLEGQSKIDWQGASDIVVPALARVPLAADLASSFLQFPEKMQEAMDHDHLAMVSYIHWPKVESPWLEDMIRIHNYYPVLGKFVTLLEFLQDTPSRGHLSVLDQKLYRTATLSQQVALKQANPISRFETYTRQRRQFDAMESTRMISALLTRQRDYDFWKTAREKFDQLQDAFETEQLKQLQHSPKHDGTATKNSTTVSYAEPVEQFAKSICSQQVVAAKTPVLPGFMVLNPLGARRVSPLFIAATQAPAVVSDLPWQKVEGGYLTVIDLPAYAYRWVAGRDVDEKAARARIAKSNVPLVDGNTLQTDGFQVMIHPESGSIAQIKNYGRASNRLSQQIAYKFSREKTNQVQATEGSMPQTTAYSLMVCDSIQATAQGPVMGEITSTGRLLDPSDGSKLAGFEQRVRVYRKCPFVEVELKLDPVKSTEDNPWKSYYTIRTAWNSIMAKVTGSLQQRFQEIGTERIEVTDGIHIQDENQFTTLIMPATPFHVKSHERMIDSILSVNGETQTTFKYRIVVDQKAPLAESYALHTPLMVTSTADRQPAANLNEAWFFHIGARNVLINRIFPAQPIISEITGNVGPRVVLELIETMGVDIKTTLRCFSPVASARIVDFQGNTLKTLEFNSEGIPLRVDAFRTFHVELSWS
jgi:alpha-mannosidase